MDRFNLTPLKNRKTAFVLSGGVVKAAAWHLGVAMALEELGFQLKNNDNFDQKNDLEISTYVGSSAGALVGLFFTAGYTVENILASFLRKTNKDKIRPITYKDVLYLKRPLKTPPRNSFYDPLEDFPFPIKQLLSPFLNISGLFSTYGLYQYINNHIIHDQRFESYKADLFVVATQLDHSRKVIFSKYNYPNPGHDTTSVYYTGNNVSDAVAASMSVPPFYAPYPLKNANTQEINYYIDGEIRETLSTHVAYDNSCEVIISSWTHTPYHYHEEVGSLINYGLPAICVQAIHLLIEKKIIESRARVKSSRDILDTVHKYMREEKFSEQHRKQILSILERKLNYRPNVTYIDICPKHDNYRIFLSNSFSLNPKNALSIVKMGYRRTFEVFESKEDLLRF